MKCVTMRFVMKLSFAVAMTKHGVELASAPGSL